MSVHDGFSDEDLERLKEKIGLCTGDMVFDLISPSSLENLLARLDAAENLNGYANHTYHCGILSGGNQCECGFDNAHKKYRKSKGESL